MSNEGSLSITRSYPPYALLLPLNLSRYEFSRSFSCFPPQKKLEPACTDAVAKHNHVLDLESMQATEEKLLSICMQLQVPSS